MKVRTMRKVFAGLLTLVLVLLLIGWVSETPILSGVAIGILLASGLCFWVFWRCPYCGKNLGTLDARHCPHCGAKLEAKPGEDPYADVGKNDD